MERCIRAAGCTCSPWQTPGRGIATVFGKTGGAYSCPKCPRRTPRVVPLRIRTGRIVDGQSGIVEAKLFEMFHRVERVGGGEVDLDDDGKNPGGMRLDPANEVALLIIEDRATLISLQASPYC